LAIGIACLGLFGLSTFMTQLAVLTIGWQAVKAARANPIRSLRSE